MIVRQKTRRFWVGSALQRASAGCVRRIHELAFVRAIATNSASHHRPSWQSPRAQLNTATSLLLSSPLHHTFCNCSMPLSTTAPLLSRYFCIVAYLFLLLSTLQTFSESVVRDCTPHSQLLLDASRLLHTTTQFSPSPPGSLSIAPG